MAVSENIFQQYEPLNNSFWLSAFPSNHIRWKKCLLQSIIISQSFIKNECLHFEKSLNSKHLYNMNWKSWKNVEVNLYQLFTNFQFVQNSVSISNLENDSNISEVDLIIFPQISCIKKFDFNDPLSNIITVVCSLEVLSVSDEYDLDREWREHNLLNYDKLGLDLALQNVEKGFSPH